MIIAAWFIYTFFLLYINPFHSSLRGRSTALNREVLLPSHGSDNMSSVKYPICLLLTDEIRSLHVECVL